LDQQVATDRSVLPDLLEATSRGDRAAFQRLYEATAPKLFGIILRITSNRSVAEEVLQETYIKVWQNAERFTPEAGKPITWLAAIARNRAIDRIRTERIERQRSDDDQAILDRLPSPSSGDPAARDALRFCLGGLEQEAQSCVVLAYCSGFSREELAERFGRPVGTIKTLLHRSIKLLRDCLDTR
jgi:RNA polymerase sigma-70 factor (ECF subfamily)